MAELKNSLPASPDDWDGTATIELPRFGRVVHDERGDAKVEWVKPPKDWAPADLSIAEDNPPAQVPKQAGFNPYDSVGRGPGGSGAKAAPDGPSRTQRTDLRKLSEHIKKMRALQERKERGDDGED